MSLELLLLIAVIGLGFVVADLRRRLIRAEGELRALQADRLGP